MRTLDPLVGCERLLRAVGRLLAGLETEREAAALIAALGEVVAERHSCLSRTPLAQFPGCRHFPTALAEAEKSPPAVRQVAAAFAQLEPHLTWQQNPNYTADNLGADFIANYAYADILGPRGLVVEDRIALGFLLLGPGLLYPDHNHPAEELYVPLGGDAEWSRAGGAWAAKAPGEAIHHASGVVHATRTGERPLLALYAWRGALDEMATLTD
jgi:hypothetical protein